MKNTNIEVIEDNAGGLHGKRIMKTYAIDVTAYRRVLVQAENEEEAREIASNECTTGIGDWDVDEWRVFKELKDEKELEAQKRCGAVEVDDW